MNRSCNKRSSSYKLRGLCPTTIRPSLISVARPPGSPRHKFFYRCNNNSRGIKCSRWHALAKENADG